MRFNLRQSGPWIGFGGVLAELFVAFPAFFSVINVPASGIALIIALLIAQLVVVARLARTRPVWCVYVPVVGLAVYFLVIYVGAHWWGWSL
ncbi:MAG TPA: hypothetical protein VMZ66_07125 [Aeromicrobium sp.]|nr:hypothetical protein [Aeromicrobium sp.]